MAGLKFTLKFENNFYVIENKDLDIVCYNENLKGIFSDLYEELNILWKEFALEDDELLDPSGRKLKEKLLNFVQKL